MTNLALTKTIPPSIIDQLNKTQKNFIRNRLSPKIIISTNCNNYKNGGLKNVNIAVKISSLQSSWIKRLFNANFHDWKILPLCNIHKSSGKKGSYFIQSRFKSRLIGFHVFFAFLSK